MFQRGRLAHAISCAAVASGCAVDPPTGVGTSTDEVQVGRTLWVSPAGDDANSGLTAARAKRTVQAAVDALGAGGERRGTVRLMPGTYIEALDVEGYRRLRVEGVGGRGSVTLRPDRTLAWDVEGADPAFRAAVRVVRSEDVTFRGVTFDFEAVRGDGVVGVLAWDSTGTFEDDAFFNMGAEGYAEVTAYVVAPSFSARRRARVAFVGNEFRRTGRGGVVLQGWSHGVVHDNSFRADGDFGYGVQVSAQSTADVRGNDIEGYSATAPDDSISAGIFIENTFTAGLDHADKAVTVRGNRLAENGYGVFIGNPYPGLAGDVDVAVRLESNAVTDSLAAGVWVTDSGRAAGSSVTVSARDNVVRGSSSYGYAVATAGDGEVHLDAARELIAGNYEGLAVFPDEGASLLDLSVRASAFTGNATGVRNFGPSVLDARGNWWGSADGPADDDGAVEVTARRCDDAPLPSRRNAVAETGGALGDAVAGAVDYCGWRRRAR